MGFLDMALAVKEKPVRVIRPAVHVKDPAPGVEIPDMRLSRSEEKKKLSILGGFLFVFCLEKNKGNGSPKRTFPYMYSI